MPKRYSSKQVVKVLELCGFFFVSQKGSHMKFKNTAGITTIVKARQKIIKPGTLSDILKQTNIGKIDFEKLVK